MACQQTPPYLVSGPGAMIIRRYGESMKMALCILVAILLLETSKSATPGQQMGSQSGLAGQVNPLSILAV